MCDGKMAWRADSPFSFLGRHWNIAVNFRLGFFKHFWVTLILPCLPGTEISVLLGIFIFVGASSALVRVLVLLSASVFPEALMLVEPSVLLCTCVVVKALAWTAILVLLDISVLVSASVPIMLSMLLDAPELLKVSALFGVPVLWVQELVLASVLLGDPVVVKTSVLLGALVLVGGTALTETP